MSCSIHQSAIVDKKAQIGSEVEVGPYSIIGPNVKLGDRCQIGPHVVIDGHTTLGVENRIFQFASVGAAPQDLKYKGEPTTLVIGDRNTIRECVTLQPGTVQGNGTTRIGSNNLFMVSSHVAHDCVVGDRNIFSNYVGLAGHVTIGNNVILGGMVGVHQFVRIGDYAFLSGGSMVGLDIPPYCTGQGDRCYLRGLNLLGLERAGFTADDIKNIKQVYRALFSSVGKISEKISALPPELQEQPAIKFLLEFLRESKRGITMPSRSSRDEE